MDVDVSDIGGNLPVGYMWTCRVLIAVGQLPTACVPPFLHTVWRVLYGESLPIPSNPLGNTGRRLRMGLIFSSGESRELKISMALNQGKTLGEAKGYANPSFDPRLNFVRPDNKRASDFFIAAQQAANAARELALKTKPDINCCSMNKSKLPPWKWVEATKALQAPNQEGAFWRSNST
eukprot:1394708-Amorphochlora_amoeboformis.AAC.1